MKYQVLARRFRPQAFGEVIGHQAILTTLLHAIELDRVAQAYLFCGTRGTGKTTLARLFAKSLNCQHFLEKKEPCNTCKSCKDITLSQSLDVLEIDGASHRGIEDIRQINEAALFAPVNGKYKIYLIDEVHMLTKEAFNALLKTLEEPPAHVKFFFCTTEPHKIPATILSRCQRFNLSRLSDEEIVTSLKKIVTALDLPSVEEEAYKLVARLAEGSLRDAQSLFDQVLAFSDHDLTAEKVRDILGLPSQTLFDQLDQGKGRYEVAFEIVAALYEGGKNLSYFLEELTHHFRNHLLAKRGMGQMDTTVYREEQLLDILELLGEAVVTMKSAPSTRVFVEMVLLNILRTHDRLNPIEIVQRLEQLEQKLTSAPAVRLETPPIKQEVPPPKKVEPKPIIQPKPRPKPKAEPVGTKQQQLSGSERAKVDTLMRFAAKELKGTLKG